MSCGSLATNLDLEMLLARGVIISPSNIPVEDLPIKTGEEVADELAGRPLIRYLCRQDVSRYLRGDRNPHYTTPTPYSPTDLISFLCLPDPQTARTHCLLLDPQNIEIILGPRLIQWGGGIEYILPHGFEQEDLIKVSALEVR